MKKGLLKSFLFLVFAFSFIFLGSKESLVNAAEMDVRAAWISYLDFGSLKDRSESDFRKNVNRMYDNVLENNLNTVYVQVRGFYDAIYPSNYFPWASYVTSDAKGPNYDPLEIMIEIAHSKGLRFEAWVNPYRVSFTTANTEKAKRTLTSEQLSYMIEYKNLAGTQTGLILDPAREESRQIVTAGIEEIVRNYNVDGIHFDDYFYEPNTYGNTTDTQRRDYVNMLVKNVYSAIKAVNPSVEFGISPAGNLVNALDHGADIVTWLSQPGYIDYLSPQIYWSDSFKDWQGNIVTMYTNRLKQFTDLNKNGTDIYVGLALYKADDYEKQNNTQDLGWIQNSNNLVEQIETAKGLGVSGYALFRYEFLLTSSTQAELANLNAYLNPPTKPIEQGDGGEVVTFENNISGLIRKFYWYILDREPAKEEIDNWLKEIQKTNMTGSQLAYNFFFSPEFVKKNYSNEEYIEKLYIILLDRHSDAAGKESWLRELKKLGNRKAIFDGFAKSAEFEKVCAKYGIRQGATQVQYRKLYPEIAEFVERFYLLCLDRNSDAAGLESWTKMLVNGGSGADLARGFFLSKELYEKNLSRADYVELLYKTFLGRNSDAAGLKTWMNVLKNNTHAEKLSVMKGFIYSKEFREICNEYGIEVGVL